MAVNSNSLAQISLQKYGSFLKYAAKKCMSKHSFVPQKNAQVGPVALRITSSIKIKIIYEDKSEGIICYEDESGEIICEGYDEGPRYQLSPRPTHHPRVAEIMNLLAQQSGEEINHIAEGVHLRGDLNYNRWV